MKNRFSPASLRAVASRAIATFVFAVAFLSLAQSARAATGADHWVGTWAAAPFAAPNAKLMLAGTDVTLRQIVHVSLGGSRVRIVLTNEFGTEPLLIGAAHIALSAGDTEIKLASANALTFGGRPSITIPAGAMAISDPADLKLPPLSDLAVSLFLPAQTIHTLSQHGFAAQTSYLVPGNVVGEKKLSGASQFASWEFLKGVDTVGEPNDAAIVTFGDSITDGARGTPNTNMRWPDELARRLQADKRLSGLAVLNEGIGGNCILHDCTGPSALARFDRDVLSQVGVKYVIVMEGINDIGIGTKTDNPYFTVPAADLIAGLQQMVERAHVHGIKVFAATLTPFVGAGYQSPEGETMRSTLNDWIRSSKSLDGIIDFDMTTRDPATLDRFLPAMDSGDHLHPGDAGYKAMGDAIDLKLFSAK